MLWGGLIGLASSVVVSCLCNCTIILEDIGTVKTIYLPWSGSAMMPEQCEVDRVERLILTESHLDRSLLGQTYLDILGKSPLWCIVHAVDGP